MPAPRPELENPPEVYYDAAEAVRYTVSSRVQHVQREMTLRALELLNMRTHAMAVGAKALLLDIGCGSGISGEVLREQGYAWVGVDVSRDMLALAKHAELHSHSSNNNSNNDDTSPSSTSLPLASAVQHSAAPQPTRVDTRHVKWGLVTSDDDDDDDDETVRRKRQRNDDNDDDDDTDASASVAELPLRVEVLHNDVGQGLPFRPGTFDGCVSVSALQWLCHSAKRGDVPQRRLIALFQSLYNVLRRGAKAALQFYPSCAEQEHMITRAAMKCGFSGGVVVDFPHSSKAKKHYLVLQAGQVAGGFLSPCSLLTSRVAHDEGVDDDEEDDAYEDEDDDDGDDDATHVRVGGRAHASRKRARAQHHDGGSARGHAGQHARQRRRRDDERPETGSKAWVLLKKAERRRRGLAATADSKYTMRRRKPRF